MFSRPPRRLSNFCEAFAGGGAPPRSCNRSTRLSNLAQVDPLLFLVFLASTNGCIFIQYTMTPDHISSPVNATVLTLYSQGGKRPFAGKLHEYAGKLSVLRIEGRFGTVPALHLAGFQSISLFEPRIVDMVNGCFEVHGLERTTEGDWVAQAWRVRLGDESAL